MNYFSKTKLLLVYLVVCFAGSSLMARKGGGGGARGGARSASVSRGSGARGGARSAGVSRGSGARGARTSGGATTRVSTGATKGTPTAVATRPSRGARTSGGATTRVSTRAPRDTRTAVAARPLRSAGTTRVASGSRHARGNYGGHRGYYGHGRGYRRRSFYRPFGFGSFWLGYPYAHHHYYTSFANSCRISNNSDVEVEVYTSRTPHLTLPAGESLYLPCGSRATIKTDNYTLDTRVRNDIVIAGDSDEIYID